MVNFLLSPLGWRCDLSKQLSEVGPAGRHGLERRQEETQMTSSLQIIEIPSCFAETRTKVSKRLEFLVSLSAKGPLQPPSFVERLSPLPGVADGTRLPGNKTLCHL